MVQTVQILSTRSITGTSLVFWHQSMKPMIVSGHTGWRRSRAFYGLCKDSHSICRQERKPLRPKSAMQQLCLGCAGRRGLWVNSRACSRLPDGRAFPKMMIMCRKSNRPSRNATSGYTGRPHLGWVTVCHLREKGLRSSGGIRICESGA